MNIEKYSALGQLLGSYFHQDWPDEFNDSSEAIHEIVNNEPNDRLIAGAVELDELLSFKLTEEAYREIMIVRIGCFFEPESENQTYVEWLLRVRSAFLGR